MEDARAGIEVGNCRIAKVPGGVQVAGRIHSNGYGGVDFRIGSAQVACPEETAVAIKLGQENVVLKTGANAGGRGDTVRIRPGVEVYGAAKDSRHVDIVRI